MKDPTITPLIWVCMEGIPHAAKALLDAGATIANDDMSSRADALLVRHAKALLARRLRRERREEPPGGALRRRGGPPSG